LRQESGGSVYLVSLVPAVSMSAILICQTILPKSADVLLTGILNFLSLQKVPWRHHGILMVSDVNTLKCMCIYVCKKIDGTSI